MRLRPRSLALAPVVLLALAGAAVAQNFAPAPPPPPAGLSPAGPNPPATICSTAWGWCPVGAVLGAGARCHCFVPPGTYLPGLARYWPYQGPVSPYLNPHTTPPATIR